MSEIGLEGWPRMIFSIPGIALLVWLIVAGIKSAWQGKPLPDGGIAGGLHGPGTVIAALALGIGIGAFSLVFSAQPMSCQRIAFSLANGFLGALIAIVGRSGITAILSRAKAP